MFITYINTWHTQSQNHTPEPNTHHRYKNCHVEHIQQTISTAFVLITPNTRSTERKHTSRWQKCGLGCGLLKGTGQSWQRWKPIIKWPIWRQAKSHQKMWKEISRHCELWIKYLQDSQTHKKDQMSNSPYWNGFISTVKLGHQCGRSPTPTGKKKSRQKAQKQHRKMLQSFQFLLREEWLASHCERRKKKGRRKTNRSQMLQIMEEKHKNESQQPLDKLDSSIKVQCSGFSMSYNEKSNKTFIKKLLIVYDSTPLRSTIFFR